VGQGVNVAGGKPAGEWGERQIRHFADEKKKKKKKKKTYVEGAVLVARHGWETRSRLHTRGGATR
jgi:hypothetical protein